MSREKALLELREAIIDLNDAEIGELIPKCLKSGLTPMEIISEGLSPGLNIIGEGFETGERFMSDLVLAGEIMTQATEILRPVMEASGKPLGDVMVIGTVQGDQHFIGKRIVSATFTGAGYRVIDIGENQPASAFVKAVKENKATVVGASAILSPVKAYCKVVNQALIDAGIRDNLIYIIGGWGMSQEWSDSVGADCYGESAVAALSKVKAIKAGEMIKLRERKKAKV